MSAYTIQLTFDCADPHALARFWAAAVGLRLEDHHELVGHLLGAGQLDAGGVIELDGRRAFRDAAAAVDPDGRLPRFLFQRVPERKQAKNRIHLDLHPERPRTDEERAAEVARLLSLGATFLHDGALGPSRWTTLADPEGNELCVS